MTQPTLRVGIVGFGFMGKMHAHAYRSLNFYYEPAPAHVEWVGVATRTESSWKQAIDNWGFKFGTTNYQELCKRDDIDIINCCTPNATHNDVLLCALEHGKHVYMDKPLCRTLDEAQEVQILYHHPLLISLLKYLVLNNENGVMGYPVDVGKGLLDFSGEEEPIGNF